MAAQEPQASVEPPPAEPSPPEEAPVQTLFLLVPRGKKVENFKVATGVEYVIGRSPNADVVLDDKKSSLEHAAISSRDGSFYVRDLGSSNGTLLRGEAIEEARIQDGDTFIVGDTPLTLSAKRYDLSDEAVLMDKTQAAFRVPAEMIDDAEKRASGEVAISGFEGRQGLPLGMTLALVGAAVVVGALALWLLLFRGGGDEEASSSSSETATTGTESAGVRVAVRPVESKNLADVIAGSGSVKPLESATVSSEVSGRVVAVNVSVGSTVARGTVLARLDDTDIRLQIDEARTSVSEEQVDLAREDHERKQRLFDEGVMTRSVLDASKNNFLSLDSAYKSSRARIRQLEQQLSKTTIRAPFGGVVVRTFASAGELIGPGTPVVELENQSGVIAELEVSDRDVVRVSLGLPVRATVDAFPGRTFDGEVQTVGTTANPATNAFTVEARVDNSDGSLRSGMIATLEIVLSSREGLAAPTDALIDVRDARATVLEVVDGIVRRRTVTIGRRVDREVEILDGLEEGALVVMTGQERLDDGDAVTAYQDN